MNARKSTFTESIDAVLGPAAAVEGFHVDELTPEYEPYDEPVDEDGLEGTGDELPPTPEVADNYVNMG